MKQPDLVDLFGTPFYGRAKVTAGGVWYYEQDGRRIPLRRSVVIAYPESAVFPESESE